MSILRRAWQSSQRNPELGKFPDAGITEPGDPDFGLARDPRSQAQFPAAAAQKRQNELQTYATNRLTEAQQLGFDTSSQEFDPLRKAMEDGQVERQPTFGERLIGIIDGPRQAINLFIQDVAGGAAGEGMENPNFWDYASIFYGGLADEEEFEKRTGLNPISGSKSLELLGWEPADEDGSWAEKISRGIMDFGFQVVTDPVTYLSFGFAGLGKKVASKVGTEAVERVSKNVMNIVDDTGSVMAHRIQDLSPYEQRIARNIGAINHDFVQNVMNHPVKASSNRAAIKEYLENKIGQEILTDDELTRFALDNITDLAVRNQAADDIVRPLLNRDFGALADDVLDELPAFAHGGIRINPFPFPTRKTLEKGVQIPGTRGLGRKLVGNRVRSTLAHAEKFDSFRRISGVFKDMGDNMDIWKRLYKGFGAGNIEGWQFSIMSTAFDSIHNQAQRTQIKGLVNNQAQELFRTADSLGLQDKHDDLMRTLMNRLEAVEDFDQMQVEQLADALGMGDQAAIRADDLDKLNGQMENLAGTLRTTLNEYRAAMESVSAAGVGFIDNYAPHVLDVEVRSVLGDIARKGAVIPEEEIMRLQSQGDIGGVLFGRLVHTIAKGGIIEESLGSSRYLNEREVGMLMASLSDNGVVGIEKNLLKQVARQPVAPDGQIMHQAMKETYIPISELNDLIRPHLEKAAEQWGVVLPRKWGGKVFNENPLETVLSYVDNLDESIRMWQTVQALREAGLAIPKKTYGSVPDMVQTMYENLLEAAEIVWDQSDVGFDVKKQLKQAGININKAIRNGEDIPPEFREIMDVAINGQRAALQSKNIITLDVLRELGNTPFNPTDLSGNRKLIDMLKESEADFLSRASHVMDEDKVTGHIIDRVRASAASKRPESVLSVVESTPTQRTLQIDLFDGTQVTEEIHKSDLGWSWINPESGEMITMKNPASLQSKVRGEVNKFAKRLAQRDADILSTGWDKHVREGWQNIADIPAETVAGRIGRSSAEQVKRMVYNDAKGNPIVAFGFRVRGGMLSGFEWDVAQDVNPNKAFRLTVDAISEMLSPGGELAGMFTYDNIKHLMDNELMTRHGARMLRMASRRMIAGLSEDAQSMLTVGMPKEAFQTQVLADEFSNTLNELFTNHARIVDDQGKLLARPEMDKLAADEDFWTLYDSARDLADQLGYGEQIFKGVKRNKKNMMADPGFVNPGIFALGGPATEGLQFQADVAVWMRQLARNSASIYTPEGVAALKLATSDALRRWRAWATIARPSFHIRNAIGGVWNNMIVGVGARDYAFVQKHGLTLRKAMRGDPAKGIAALTPDQAIAKLPAEVQPYFKAAWEEDVLSGFVTSEFRNLVAEQRVKRMNLLNAMDVDNFALTRVGGLWMESIEDFLRMSAFVRWYDPKNPASKKVAKEMVHAVHFDYVNLTPMETAIKSIVPFFVWTRRNLPLQMRVMAENPSIIQRYRAMMAGMETAMEGEDPTLAEGDNFTAFAAGTRFKVNEGTPFWAKIMIDPDLPVRDLVELPNPNVGEVFDYAKNLLGPQIGLAFDINDQREFPDVNAPAPMNTVLKGLAAVGMYDRTTDGDVRIPYWMRTIMETAVPFARETVEPFFGGPTDPNRQARYGIGEDDGGLESVLKSLGSTLARGAGVKMATPADARGSTARSRDELEKLVQDLRLQGKLPPSQE